MSWAILDFLGGTIARRVFGIHAAPELRGTHDDAEATRAANPDEGRHVVRSPKPSRPASIKRSLMMPIELALPVAEVDDLRQRYSPMMYIEHLKGAMQEREHEWFHNVADLSGESVACRCGAVTYSGDAPKGPCAFIPGRAEWSRIIKAMPADVAAPWWFEFDELTEAGAWVKVLTPEQLEQVRAKMLEKLDEYRAQSDGLMVNHGVNPAIMHAIIADPGYEPPATEDDDDDALVWAEDIEDADIGEGETDGKDGSEKGQ